MHDLWRCPWLHSEAAWACIPSPVVFISDLVQGYSVEHAEARGQGTVAAGSELAVLLDLGCLCGILLPGPVCHRSSSELRYEVGGAGVLSAGRGTAECSCGC